MKCAVVGCHSSDQVKGFQKSGITFFPFPNEANIQKAWKNACSREDTFDIKYARVCSKHFKESDYSHNLAHIELLGGCPKNYRAIKPDAIPSEHLPRKLNFAAPASTCEAQNSKGNQEQVNYANSILGTLLLFKDTGKGNSPQTTVVNTDNRNIGTHSYFSHQNNVIAPIFQPSLVLRICPNNEAVHGNKLNQLQTCSSVVGTSVSNIPFMTFASENTGSNVYFNNFSNFPSSSEHTRQNCEVKNVDFQNANVTDPLSFPVKEEENDLEIVETFQCRTCLKSTEATACIAINQNFFSSKTAKEMIVFLVPEMDSKLRDDEVVCHECVEVLKSTMLFIEKCLEVEAIFAKKEQNEKEAVVLETCKLELKEPQGNVVVIEEHDYCVKYETEATKNGAEDEIHEDNVLIDHDDVPITIEVLPQCYENDVEEPEPNMVGMPPTKPVKTKKKRTFSRSNKIKVVRGPYRKRKRTFSCLTCLECFHTKEEYEEHLDIHPPYSCDVCGKTFKKRESMRAHKFTHNDHNSFICEVCGKGFKDGNNLRHHLRSHVSEKSFMCDRCPKVFKTENLVKRHIKFVHDKTTKMQCTECGKMVCNKFALQVHVKVVHLKEKPYECNICQRRFGRLDYLNNHKLRHAGEGWPSSITKGRRPKRYKNPEEPLPCKFCGEMCKGVVGLRRHLMLHLRRHPCKFCPLTFPNNARLKSHEETHEGGAVKFIRCNVCWKKCKTEEALDKHVALHDKPRHSCDLCGETFNRKFLLIQHKLKEHSKISEAEQIDSILEETLLAAGVLPT